MTTKLNRLFLFAALLFAVAPARAWIFDQAPDKTMTIHYRLNVAANISTSTVLIDLSNTTTWPHKDTGEIDISSVKVEFDKLAASTATAKIGIANYVGYSTGSVTWFYAKENNLNVSNADIGDPLHVEPCFIRARAVPASTVDTDGGTPYILSSEITSGSALYKSSATYFNSPLSTTYVNLSRGDILLFVQTGSAAVTVTVDLQYHSEK